MAEEEKLEPRGGEVQPAATPIVDVDRLVNDTRITRRQWLAIFICAFLAMLDGFDIHTMAYAAPQIAREWEIASSEFGPTFSAYVLGGVVGAMILAPLGDRIGPKRIVIASVILFSVFSLLTPLAQSLTGLTIARVFTGIGLSGAMPALTALIAAYSPARVRPRILTAAICCQLFGGVIGGAVSAFIMPAYGWQSIFYIGGVVPLLVIPFAIRYISDPLSYLVSVEKPDSVIYRNIERIGKSELIDRDSTFFTRLPAVRNPIGALFSDGRLAGTIFVWLIITSANLLLSFVTSWMPTILRDSELSLQQAALGGALLSFGGMTGSILLSFLMSRFGVSNMMAFGFLTGAGLYVALSSLGGASFPYLVLTIFFSGFFALGATYCMSVLMVSFYPRHLHNTGVGYAIGLSRIGAAAGPMSGGIILGAGAQPFQLFYFAALFATVAGFLVLQMKFVARRQGRHI